MDGASIFDNLTREVNDDDLNIPISREAIQHSILALHVNRATGTDGLCIEMYKCTLDAVLPYLHVLFNRVFDIGQFPEQWSESIISPIHKKGSKFEPNNYNSCIDSDTWHTYFKVLFNRETGDIWMEQVYLII